MFFFSLHFLLTSFTSFSVSKPSPVGSYAALAGSKGIRSQITSISTATGAFKLATMRRDSSPYQKSTGSSGANGTSPRTEVATVWRRSEDKPTPFSLHSSSLDSDKKTQAPKNVTFDPNVKETAPKHEATTTDDEPTEEELLRQGIHLARRLSTDGPRREFNWDEEDDDTSWSEISKTPIFPLESSPSRNDTTASSASPSLTTTNTTLVPSENASSPTKRYTGIQKSGESPSIPTHNTWKIPSHTQHIVPISKQMQELSEKRQQQAHHGNSYSSSHNNYNDSHHSMAGWNSHGGQNDGYHPNHQYHPQEYADNRYRYSDYDKRYHPDNPLPSKTELFNEHNGQIETYSHRSRGGQSGRMGSISSRNTHTASDGALETYERGHTAFSNQTNQNEHAHSPEHAHQQLDNAHEIMTYQRGGGPNTYQNLNDAAMLSQQKSLLEVQEEYMRVSREQALKRKEEEARLEREREESIKKKAEERLAKLEAKKSQDDTQHDKKSLHISSPTPAQKTLETIPTQRQQPVGSFIQNQGNHHSQQQIHASYIRRDDDPQRRVGRATVGNNQMYLSNKPRRGSNFNSEDNPAIRAVNSVISDDSADQLRSNKPKLWSNTGSTAVAGGPGLSNNTHNNSSQSYSNVASTTSNNNHQSSGGHQSHGGNARNGQNNQNSSGRAGHQSRNNGREIIWGSTHAQRPGTDGDVWRPFSSSLQNVPGNVYQASPPIDHRQEFSQHGLPTSSPSGPSQSHHMLPPWGTLNNSGSQAHFSSENPYDQQMFMKQESSRVIQGAETQGPWPQSQTHHQSQRSVSMPSSPMSSIHSNHHQQAHHSASESSSANGSTTKLVNVRSSIHDTPSMSRGFSRFFPTVGTDEKEHSQQQRSPAESITGISTGNLGPNNTPSSNSPVHHSSMSTVSAAVTPTSSGIGLAHHHQQSPQLASRTQPSSTNVTPSRNSQNNNAITPVPGSQRSVVVTSDDNSYMSTLIFSNQGVSNNFVRNIVLPPSTLGGGNVSSYSPNVTDGSLFGDSANVANPRIILPPSQSSSRDNTSRQAQQLQPQIQIPQNQQQNFKPSLPSINSIQALQTTIAEKLGSKKLSSSLQNGSKNSGTGVSRDLPIPVSPIVLSENTPPFDSSEQKRIKAIEKVFTPQATNQEEQYTYVTSAENDSSKSARIVEQVQSEAPIRKPQSFADAVALSLEAEKRKAALSTKNLESTAQPVISTISKSETTQEEPFLKPLSNVSSKQILEIATKLVPWSNLKEFEESFENYFSSLDGANGNENVPIAMPFYNTPINNQEIENKEEHGVCNGIPKDWDKGLRVPRDEFICTLFYWSENQAAAYNREFKPRTTSRVALLIPGNTQKILTSYRIGNLGSLASAPSNGLSLDELIENKVPETKPKSEGTVAGKKEGGEKLLASPTAPSSEKPGSPSKRNSTASKPSRRLVSHHSASHGGKGSKAPRKAIPASPAAVPARAKAQ